MAINLSTVAQLTGNLPAATDAELTLIFMTAAIQAGDEEVYDDLSKYVDWDEVEALSYVPRTINRLSQYKAVVLTIIRTWRNDIAALTDDELSNSVFRYYQEKYEALLTKVEQGDVVLLDDSNEVIEPDVVRGGGVGRII